MKFSAAMDMDSFALMPYESGTFGIPGIWEGFLSDVRCITYLHCIGR
jgi:hypothetical protein